MQKLISFLEKLSTEEVGVLHKMLDIKEGDIKSITDAYGKLSLPFKGFMQSKLSYEEILVKIANKHDLVIEAQDTLANKEKELFQKLFVKEFENLSELERESFIQNLEKNGLDKSQIASLTSVTAIAAAQASGFGVYVLASSTVGAITGMLGITLPFAFYTGMSTAISVAIGPIGFLVLGYAMYKSFKHVKSWDEAKIIFQQTSGQIKTLAIGDLQKTIMVFKYIGSLRIMKIKNEEDKITQINSDTKTIQEEQSNIAIEIDGFNMRINTVKTEIEILNRKVEELNRVMCVAKDRQYDLTSDLDLLRQKSFDLGGNLKTKERELEKHLKNLNFLKNN
ncbi:hypothetical protein [Polaribacter atrinae]|uniref:hypothetical protein n=1 Tax=Polaribacter atrinae TaxID=1333662 RepID=UPI00249360C2|nr:hypothetical protein [Polaribacter atrinae]